MQETKGLFLQRNPLGIRVNKSFIGCRRSEDNSLSVLQLSGHVYRS